LEQDSQKKHADSSQNRRSLHVQESGKLMIEEVTKIIDVSRGKCHLLEGLDCRLQQ
jgi:hypothetical protein